MISYHYRATFDYPHEPGENVAVGDMKPADLSKSGIGSDTPINADHWTRREQWFGVAYGHGEVYQTLYADMHVEVSQITQDQLQDELGRGYSNGSWGKQHLAWDKLFVD
ncbi:MAG: hypothetical protein ACE37H_06655 [Phycisphaeraceae bacterium]